MLTKTWLHKAGAMWLSLSCLSAEASEVAKEAVGEVKAEVIDLNMPTSDAYLPNILTPVLMSHRESRANRVKAIVLSGPNAEIFGPELTAIRRDGQNFQIELNAWHPPIRIEQQYERPE